MDSDILSAARALLREDGLDALSIAAVARQAGVGRPTVYRRFADRTELALAVLFHDLASLVEQAMDAADADAALLDQLCSIVTPFFAYYAERPGLAQVLIQLTVTGRTPWNVKLQGQVWGFLGQIAARARAAQTRGQLASHIDPDVLAQAFFAFYFSVVIGGFQGLYPDVDAQVRAFRQVMAQHLRG